MDLKAEAEDHWLRSEILPKILLNAESRKNPTTSVRMDSISVRDIRINFIGTEESFMLTTCYRAAVTYDIYGVVHTRSLVVKKTPQLPPEVFDAINFRDLFGNEIVAYTAILPALLKFAPQSSIIVPKYYYSELRPSFATIVLEDFSVNGWSMSQEKVNLSLEHVLLAVKYLAHFHGVGFAMKEMLPENFSTITSQLKETRFENPDVHPEWKLSQTQSMRRLEKATRMLQPTVSEEFLQRLLQLVGDHFFYGRQIVQPVEPMATLCHGDYLRNNVAYRYEPNGKKPEAVLMFDLQTLRLASPMLDLAVFLGLSTFAEVRYANLSYILNVYCLELTTTYEALTKASLPHFMCHDSLMKEYVRFLPYSVSIAAFFLMTLVEPDKMSSEEMLLQQRTSEEVTADTMTRGGRIVDQELAHQVWELYQLSLLHGVDVCEGINLPA